MKDARSKADGKRADNKLKSKGSGAGKKASKKAAKDPNKPKRPPSAFFVFMEEFRQQFKKDNPDNKSVAAVGKAAGAKWKTMSDADKAPYVAKAEKRKSDYTKNMQAYNNKLAGVANADEDESDKSKSEVNDEDDEQEESGEEDDEE